MNPASGGAAVLLEIHACHFARERILDRGRRHLVDLLTRDVRDGGGGVAALHGGGLARDHHGFHLEHVLVQGHVHGRLAGGNDDLSPAVADRPEGEPRRAVWSLDGVTPVGVGAGGLGAPDDGDRDACDGLRPYGSGDDAADLASLGECSWRNH